MEGIVVGALWQWSFGNGMKGGGWGGQRLHIELGCLVNGQVAA